MNPAIDAEERECPECGENVAENACTDCEWMADEPDFEAMWEAREEAGRLLEVWA